MQGNRGTLLRSKVSGTPAKEEARSSERTASQLRTLEAGQEGKASKQQQNL